VQDVGVSSDEAGKAGYGVIGLNPVHIGSLSRDMVWQSGFELLRSGLLRSESAGRVRRD
jgi:hypothetical protein